MSLPIFYSAFLLTGVNLLLRLAGTAFQVYISARLGAQGIGLLQLVLSVGMLATTVGIGGVRTAAMYLTAEELGKKQPQNIPCVLHGCFIYSILCSSAVSVVLYLLSPRIASGWIGSADAIQALRLIALSLPVNCLCGVMTGYFTARNRIGTLASIEVVEQILSMCFTILLLTLWAGSSPARACGAIVLGSSVSTCLSFLLLLLFSGQKVHRPVSAIPIPGRLIDTAVPLAAADDLKAGISAAENMMVPKRLSLYPGQHNPLAVFGMICGMVFPILMFPASILFGLNELLIPELSRCRAAGSKQRIQYLAMRTLRLALFYGAFWGGLLNLLSESICMMLYKNPQAGLYLSAFAFLAPMLYCDAATDAMTKGLGQQRACVRYNILTSALDVLFLYILLPRYGIRGYFFSFLITHLLNFILSLRRLLSITGKVVSCRVLMGTLFSMIAALWCVSFLHNTAVAGMCYGVIFFCNLSLLQLITREDALWLKNLIHKK